MRVERVESVIANAFEELQEGPVADLAVERECNTVRIRRREVRQWLSLANTLHHDPVNALSRPLHQAAPSERLGDAAIAGELLIENVVRGDPRREAARADETRAVDARLRDAELLVAGGVTCAALVLLGTTSALGRLLAQAEVVFDCRSSSRPGPAQHREEFRAGFLAYYERIWELVNSRNDLQHYQERLVMHAVSVVPFEGPERIVGRPNGR